MPTYVHRAPTVKSTSPRNARRTATLLATNAKLFHRLRRHVPSSKRAITWNVNQMKGEIQHTSLSGRMRRRFEQTIDRVNQNAEGLRNLSRALHRGHLTPKAAFIEMVSAFYARSPQKKASVNVLQDIPERDIRLRVDWIGPHFYVQERNYPILEKLMQNGEAFGGKSFLLTNFHLHLKGVNEGDAEIRLSSAPFSISIHHPKKIYNSLVKHERWHDFEKKTNTIKYSSMPEEKEYLSPAILSLRLEGWFRNELSASVFGDEHHALTGLFAQRVKALFKRVRSQMKDTPEYAQKWTKRDWDHFDSTEKMFLQVIDKINNGWPNDPETETAKRDPQNPRARNTHERTRKRQYAYLLLAGLISMTPVNELEEQLRVFLETSPAMGLELPYRRFPRRY